MKVSELVVQAQMKIDDGSVVVFTSPPLAPSTELTVDEVKDTIMSLGEDLQTKMRKEQDKLDPRIIRATGNGIRFFNPGE